MLAILTLLIGILLIFLFGYNFTRLLLPKAESLEQISLGFVFGLGIFTFVWFLLNWIGIPYNLTSGIILLITLNSIVYICCRLFSERLYKKFKFDLSYFNNLNYPEKTFICIILFLFLSAIIQDVYWPIRYWDSLALYDFRGKIFAETGFMQPVISGGYFLGYPLLTSLAHTWVYLLGGTNPNFYYAFLYISLVLAVFYNIKKLNIGRLLTIFLTLMVAVSPMLYDHTGWAYTNLPFAIYIILGTIYLYLGIKDKEAGVFTASAIFIGLSTWTRSFEPFWIACLFLAVILSIIKRKWLWPFVYVGVTGFFIIPWKIFINGYKVPDFAANVVKQVTTFAQPVTQVTQTSSTSVFISTFNFILTNVVEVYLIYILLLAAVILVKLFIKSKNWLLSIMIIIYLAMACAGTFIFIKTNSHWQEVGSSLTRMLMFIPPLIIFLSAELVSEIKRR